MIDLKPHTESYKRFMGLNSFPMFTTEYFDVDLNQEFVIIAQAEYDFQTKEQKLLMPGNIEYYPKHLLYHELTHILDANMYSNGDKNHDCCLAGYMEYHASQVELMCLMGAKTIRDKLAFSMDDLSNHLDWTVGHCVDEKYKAASRLLSSLDKFERIHGTGVLFNYLGMRSICSMFAIDYKDDRDYSDIVAHISSFLWIAIKQFMTGWVSDVEQTVALYSNIYRELA